MTLIGKVGGRQSDGVDTSAAIVVAELEKSGVLLQVTSDLFFNIQEGLHVEINAFNTQFQIEIREDVINKNSAVLSYTRHLLTTYVPRQK